jgi:hypothetical protein
MRAKYGARRFPSAEQYCPITIDSHAVGGNLTDQNNAAASQVLVMRLLGACNAVENSAITGGENTANSK